MGEILASFASISHMFQFYYYLDSIHTKILSQVTQSQNISNATVLWLYSTDKIKRNDNE